MEPRKRIALYHDKTKHGFHRMARSPGYLDWATQPDPFRRFEEAPTVSLSLSDDEASPSYDDLFVRGAVRSRRLSFKSVSIFFELSLAISAWKELQGSRWALRINPSSGNLHPTEGYLAAGPVDGLDDQAGVYHYAPKDHALERRTAFATEHWRSLICGFPESTFLVGLTSIHWREAWKYGERAYRYCQHDVGHALAALAISGAILGWRVQPLDGMSDAEIARLLGLDRAEAFEGAEREHPDLLLAVVCDSGFNADGYPRSLPPDVTADVARGAWEGFANSLSPDHVEWELIDNAAAVCEKPAGVGPTPAEEQACAPLAPERAAISAAALVRQRRSAVAMDGRTGVSARQFYLMLDRVMPRYDRAPWTALGPPTCVHLGLFVHLVDGIPPGLYCLVRSPAQLTPLRSAMSSSFSWEQPPGCPPTLPLFLLRQGDCREVAWRVSCDQQIAGAGAFSLGMIAEFEPRLREHGAWFYRRLFWETGVIGQILYLEAEAAGVRATGIGCFFDDPVHDVFSLRGMDYQSLYHFTIGGPVEDTRLTTRPPYSR